MKRILNRARQALITLGVTILLMVALLLSVVFPRPLMIAGLATAFVIVLASVFSRRVCAWIETPD